MCTVLRLNNPAAIFRPTIGHGRLLSPSKYTKSILRNGRDVLAGIKRDGYYLKDLMDDLFEKPTP